MKETFIVDRGGSSGVVPPYVAFPVDDDPLDQVRGGDPICSLGGQEAPRFFHVGVGVVRLGRPVWNVVVADEIDIVLVEELDVRDPGRREYDGVDPFAAFDVLDPLFVGVDGGAFPAVSLDVVADADDDFHVLEAVFHLLENAGVSEVEQVEDAVGVKDNRVFGVLPVSSARFHGLNEVVTWLGIQTK